MSLLSNNYVQTIDYNHKKKFSDSSEQVLSSTTQHNLIKLITLQAYKTLTI